ncbi:C2 domain-containing protein, partial [Rhodotorula diobovata]
LGTLICIVLRAKNLPNKARIGKQNPYCTVQYGLHKKRTATIERGGQQPEWDAEFRFEILREGLGGEEQSEGRGAVVTREGGVMPVPTAAGTDAGGRVLRIACWADDARDPKLIGEGELDFEGTIRSGKFDDWVPLARKGRYAGEVYLELTWYS